MLQVVLTNDCREKTIPMASLASLQQSTEMISQKIGDPEVPFILQTVKDQLSSSSLLQASLIASGLSVWPPPSPPGSQTRMCRSRSPLKQEEVGRWRSILFQPEQLKPPRVVSQGCDGAKVTFQWGKWFTWFHINHFFENYLIYMYTIHALEKHQLEFQTRFRLTSI